MSRLSYMSLLLLMTDPVIAQPLAASAINQFGSAMLPILDIVSIVTGFAGLWYIVVLFFRVMSCQYKVTDLFGRLAMLSVTFIGPQIWGMFVDRQALQEDIRPSLFSRLIEWVGIHWSGLAGAAAGIAAAAAVTYMAYRGYARRTLSREARRQVREVLNALDIVEHYRMYWVGTCPVHEVAKRLRSSRIETFDATRDQLLELLEHTHNGVPLGDEMLKKFKRFKSDMEKMATDGTGTRVVWPPGAEVVKSSDERRDGAKSGAILSKERPDRTGRRGIDCVSRPYTQSGKHIAGGLTFAPVGLVLASDGATGRLTDSDAGCRSSDDSGAVSRRGGLGCGGNEPDRNYQ